MTEELGSTSYPSLARARFSQAVLICIGLFSTMDLMVVGLLIEPMKHELGLTDVEVGLAHTAAYFGAYGLLAIPMGMLVDRWVRVRLLLMAMLLWCASLGLVGLSHELWLLAAAKAAMGVANAITYPAALSLLADNFAPNRRVFGTASYSMGQQLGSGAALLVGGSGYSALVRLVASDPNALGGVSPWRAVSLVFAGIGLLLVPAIVAMREPARQELRHVRRDRQGGSFRALWEYRAFLVPLVIGMMALGGQGSSLQTWFAPALTRLYGLQPGEFAVWASVVAVSGGVVGLALSTKLINLVLFRNSERGGMLVAATAALIAALGSFFAVMPSVWGFAVLGGIYLVASGVALAVPIITITLRIPNELRGLCMGIYVVLFAFASMIGAPLTGYVNQLLGGDAMLGEAMASVGAPFALIAALSFWLASRTRTITPPPCQGA